MKKLALIPLFVLLCTAGLFAQQNITVHNNTGCDITIYLYEADASCNPSANTGPVIQTIPSGTPWSAPTTTNFYYEAELVVDNCATSTAAAVGSPGTCSTCASSISSVVLWKTHCSCQQLVEVVWDSCDQTINLN